MDPTIIDVSSIKLEMKSSNLLACRICLVCDVKLYNIRELGLDRIYEETMGTTLSVWDGLPQHLCSFCRALLLKSHELRIRCHRAEELLKQSLVHQHFITTDYICNIDRKAHRLTHKLTHICSNAGVRLFTHEDKQTNLFNVKADTINKRTDMANKAKAEEKLTAVSEDYLNNFKELDLFSESVSFDKVDSELDAVSDFDIEDLNIEETDNSDYVKSLQAKKIVKSKPAIKRRRIKKTENAPKRKPKRREEPFETEEHFKPFEEKFHFKVIKLTDEEAIKELEARKQSENYKHAVEKCEFCFKGFLSIDTYTQHMKSHDPARGPYECHICHSRHGFAAKLRTHVNAHILKFQCTLCSMQITSKAYAELHAGVHAGTTFKCKHCDMQFLKITSRNTHVRLSHPTANADGGTCELCGETFMSALGLRMHRTRRHQQMPAPYRLRCRKCRVQFDSLDAVEKHRRDQLGGTCDPKLSYCAQCGAWFSSDSEVTQHRVSEHGLQLFTCDTCSKTFTSADSLGTHIDRVHLCIKPKMPLRPGYKQKNRGIKYGSSGGKGASGLVCEHCGKCFSTTAVLRLHVQRHTGERPFKCELCPKTYITRQGLLLHEPFHTQERKFQCPECPATFMQKSSVRVHMVIHRGEKAHRCKICDKTFTQSGSLYTHVRYVHMKITPPPRNRKKKTAA